MKQPQWFRKVPPFIVQQPERHQKSCHLALLHSLRHGWGQLAHNNTCYRSRPVIWQDERGNWWRIADTSFTKTGKSSSQTWQPRRLPARILKSNRWWPSGASRHFEENLGRHRPASVMKGVYQSYGRLSAQQAGKPLKQNQQIQMLWKNMYANAPEAPAAQNIYSLGTHSITYPQPHLRGHVLHGDHLGEGAAAARVCGKDFPVMCFEPMAPLENHGVHDFLRRLCCALPMFPGREWIMGHWSSRSR